MKFQLESCVWELTLACCFDCKHCGSRGGIAREGELSTQECLRVVRQLQQLGCKRVSLIGGEVFMRQDWDTIAGALADCGICVNLITNAFLFSEDSLKRLLSSKVDSISISLDGPRQIHDKYRKNGSFECVRETVEILAQNDIPVSLVTTLNRKSAECLEDMYAEIKEWRIEAWQLQACSPMGYAQNNRIEYAFDVQKVIRFVEEHVRKAPFLLGLADNIGYFTESEGYLRGNLSGEAVFAGCSAGITSIGIDSVGNVRGCQSMYDEYFVEGNLREKSLREIWDSPESFAYNRKFQLDCLTGRCSACEAGGVCAGGCRSYNYFVHHKLYEAPFCAKK